MSDHFEKHVQIAKADADRRVVVGVAMEPNRVDTQGDYERPDTIESLSEGFMERLAGGDAKSGVMHATFPSGNVLSHVENRVLSASETIGDAEYPAGTWVIGKKVRDDTLWNLIQDETLTGFSIGGHIHDGKTHAVDDLPNGVSIDDDIREAADEAGVREITDATIHEISIVDFPAVQRAQIQTAKADDLSKAAGELTESVDTATEYLVEERGHDPEPARELAAFLNREKTAGNDRSWLTRAKKFFSGETAAETEKAGRTLSDSNVKSAMAVHDASLDMLGRSDVAHGRQRFTDDPSRSFDIGSYGLQAENSTSDELAESSTEGTATTDTADSTVEDMNEDELDERFESLNERFDTIEEKLSDEAGDADASDEPEKTEDGEEITIEQLAEQQEKFADGLEQVVDTLEQMASAQGVSQQADKGQGSDETEKTWETSPFGVGGGR